MAKSFNSRVAIFASFVLCCASIGLLSVSAGTRSWLVADCTNLEQPSSDLAYGQAWFGLFTGNSTLVDLGTSKKKYWIVCLDHLCMYSSAETEEEREDSINQTINANGLKYRPEYEEIQGLNGGSGNTVRAPMAYGRDGLEYVPVFLESENVPELMSQGLWVATITMLFGALVFAVAGATFAVINTATTPIEFITGIPGLYIWNGSAAVCALVCVIIWGVQFSLHLTSNVLIEDAADGWTTEGLEHLGYSYWLVVVSVVVHLANCFIIAIGTYERKVKTQYEAPETKPGNIMLY